MFVLMAVAKVVCLVVDLECLMAEKMVLQMLEMWEMLLAYCSDK